MSEKFTTVSSKFYFTLIIESNVCLDVNFVVDIKSISGKASPPGRSHATALNTTDTRRASPI